MVHHAEFMDVADSDFLSNNKEQYDDDSEFETVFENYFAFSAAKNRFFARKLPLHVLLGSGKAADIILWREKRITASILAGVTVIWFNFKMMEYTMLSFICDSLIIILAILFLWTHLTSFINISPPKSSAFNIPKGMLVNTAVSMTKTINKLLKTFGVLASGRDFKKFLLVTWTLGAVSLLGIWFTASTIFYIGQLPIILSNYKPDLDSTVKESTGAEEINTIESRFDSVIPITYLQQLYDSLTIGNPGTNLIRAAIYHDSDTFFCSVDVGTVTLLTVPAVYEKNQDIVDIISEKALIELNNQYAALMKKFLGKSQHLQDSDLE